METDIQTRLTEAIEERNAALAACERMRKALKNIVGTGALSNSNMGWRKCIELAETALIPSAALHGWVRRELLEEVVKDLAQWESRQWMLKDVLLGDSILNPSAALTAARAELERTK